MKVQVSLLYLALAVSAVFLALSSPTTALEGVSVSGNSDKTIAPNESETLFQFSIEWYRQNIDAVDLIEYLTNGLSPFPTPTPTLPGPTLTPTLPGATPTPTPTEMGSDTFDLQDLFILAQNSNWHYTGIQGTGTEDDFSWIVESQMQDVGGGKMATRIRTDTDDPSDEFNGFVFFWYIDPSGQIFLHGFFFAEDEDFGIATIPSQDVIFDDPVLIGGDGMMEGDTVMDEGAGQVFVQSLLGDSFVTAKITSSVEYTGFIPSFETPLGIFTNVLRVTVDISAEISSEVFEITNSTLFLKEGVGMIAQDQEPDPNDAQIQAIDQGQVAGVGVVPN